MKNIIYTLLIIPALSSAQVGVGTSSPNATLDVSGDINVRNQLYLGGSDSSLGNPGVNGQILTSNGDQPATWQDVRLPDGIGSFVMSSKYVKNDEVGLSLSEGSTTSYTENGSITGWSVISSLDTDFKVVNESNKVSFSAQTVVQRDNTDIASYACAVFVDNQLKAVRSDVINTTVGGYKTFNLNVTLNNVTPGDHVAKFACRGRYINEGNLSVGRVINSTFLSPGMAKTVFKTIILEPM